MGFATKLGLAKIPNEYQTVLLQAETSFERISQDGGLSIYKLPEDILAWLMANVVPTDEWNVRICSGEMSRPSEDLPIIFRLIYYVEVGGETVTTKFLDKNGSVSETHVFKNGDWILMRTDIPHEIQGVDPQQKRVILTTKVMAQNS